MENNNFILRTVPIFKHLDEIELTLVGQYCFFKDLNQEEKLFHFDEVFKHICVVITGSIAIYSNSDAPRMIAKYMPNESFGELSLCGIDKGHNQAIALEPTRVMLFPSIPFEDFIEKHATIGAKIIYQLLSNISYRIRHTNKLISQNYEWVQQLQKAMYTDRLTGFYNRQYFEDEINKNAEYTIIVLKPNDFKSINDICGHSVGDAVLTTLAQTIRKTLPHAIHIRYRGDEFILLLANNHNSINHFNSIVNSLNTAIATIPIHTLTKDTISTLSVSIGIAHGLQQEAFNLAYQRMWEAYKNRGNRIIEATE